MTKKVPFISIIYFVLYIFLKKIKSRREGIKKTMEKTPLGSVVNVTGGRIEISSKTTIS